MKVSECFTGQAMALTPEHAGGLLAVDIDLAQGVDDQALAMSAVEVSADLTVRRGERFAVSRGLAVVPVRGILTPNSEMLERYLGWTTYYGLQETLQELSANEDVRGVVLHIDTPGGAVLGLSAAAKAVAEFNKPIHGLVHPLAASAGYYIASQCDDLTMVEGAEVGSIGVMITSVDPVGPGSTGMQWTILRSSHARAKNADASTDAGRALLQDRADAFEADFHNAVAQGRGIPVDELPARLSLTDDVRDGGAVFGGMEAIERGLVDVVGATASQFYVRMAEQYAPAQSGRTSRSAQALAQAALAQS